MTKYVNRPELPPHRSISFTLGRGGYSGMRDNPNEINEFYFAVAEHHELEQLMPTFDTLRALEYDREYYLFYKEFYELEQLKFIFDSIQAVEHEPSKRLQEKYINIILDKKLDGII